MAATKTQTKLMTKTQAKELALEHIMTYISLSVVSIAEERQLSLQESFDVEDAIRAYSARIAKYLGAEDKDHLN